MCVPPQKMSCTARRSPSSDSVASTPEPRRQWSKVSSSLNSTVNPSSIATSESWAAESPLGSVAVTFTVVLSGVPELSLSVSPVMDTDTADVSMATAT